MWHEGHTDRPAGRPIVPSSLQRLSGVGDWCGKQPIERLGVPPYFALQRISHLPGVCLKDAPFLGLGRSIMQRYYYIDSNGPDTNLQFYTLKQAKIYWDALTTDVASSNEVDDFHERCVFVVNTVGLSVAQLLGQNNPVPEKGRVPSPIHIFGTLVDANGLDQGLKKQFKEFIDAYDHCRHFGLTDGNVRHFQVNEVTFDKTRKLFEFGLFVWETVISIYRREPNNDLADLDLENVHREQ